MSTRQVASLLAAAAPEVLPPRDTLRAVALDRYTLKVSIDQECEQGLRLLKDLMAHVDPRMSWGDLVARVVARGGGAARPARRRARAAPEGCRQRRRITATDTEGATCGWGCGRDGSARRRIHGAGAESDRCCRGRPPDRLSV